MVGPGAPGAGSGLEDLKVEVASFRPGPGTSRQQCSRSFTVNVETSTGLELQLPAVVSKLRTSKYQGLASPGASCGLEDLNVEVSNFRPGAPAAGSR